MDAVRAAAAAGAGAAATAKLQRQLRELTAALESWQPGSFAAAIDGGASLLWSGCARQHACAVAVLFSLAASPLGCAAAALSHALPRCLEILARLDESDPRGGSGTGRRGVGAEPRPSSDETRGGGDETARQLAGRRGGAGVEKRGDTSSGAGGDAGLRLAILRTLTRVVRGAREASVPLALGGAIPLLQRIIQNASIHTEGIHTDGIHTVGIHTEGIHTEGIHTASVHTEGIHTAAGAGEEGATAARRAGNLAGNNLEAAVPQPISRQRTLFAAERLLFEMATHGELSWPCLQQHVLSTAVATLLRPVPLFTLPYRRTPAQPLAPAPHGLDGEALGLNWEMPGRGLGVEREAAAGRFGQWAEADAGEFGADGPCAETEVGVRQAAVAAVRALVSPPQV